MDDDRKAGLEKLGVLISRTSSKVGEDRVFVVLEENVPVRVPESMIETQPISVFEFPLMLNR